MIIYELAHVGRSSGREGFYLTVDLAKRAAAEKIEEYEVYADEPDTEGMVKNPQWVMDHELTFGARPIGKKRPILIYGELGSGFAIREIEVIEE